MCKPTDQRKRGLWLARQLLSFPGSQTTCVFASIKKKQNIPRGQRPRGCVNPPNKASVDYGLRGSQTTCVFASIKKK
jgi:hypothetical protein